MAISFGFVVQNTFFILSFCISYSGSYIVYYIGQVVTKTMRCAFIIYIQITVGYRASSPLILGPYHFKSFDTGPLSILLLGLIT